MGDVVDIRPPVVISEQFHFVSECADLGKHKLVVARSMIDGVAHLSLLLTDLPKDVGFEILATFREDGGAHHALKFVADAVSLAALHLMPE